MPPDPRSSAAGFHCHKFRFQGVTSKVFQAFPGFVRGQVPQNPCRVPADLKIGIREKGKKMEGMFPEQIRSRLCNGSDSLKDLCPESLIGQELIELGGIPRKEFGLVGDYLSDRLKGPPR